MAKFYLDTEFIEGYKKPIKWLPTIGNFNKPYHSIQLVSIGIICSDGREYYAISNEFKYEDANDWVKKNVLNDLFYHNEFSKRDNFKSQLKRLGRTNYQIANDITEFILDPTGRGLYSLQGFTDDYFKELRQWIPDDKPEFYGYYADYDWVLLSSLFGTMMDLPKSFPMYCIDLKQILDEKTEQRNIYINNWKDGHVDTELMAHNDEIRAKYASANKDGRLEIIKSIPYYPKQKNEHHALEDARWNKALHEFLKSI